MLVGPCCVMSGGVDDSENRVHPYEVPGINWRATLEGVTGHLGRIERECATIGPGRCSSVKLGLIDTDPFLIFRRGAVGLPRCADAGEYAIARRGRRRSQHAVIGDIIKYTHRPRGTSGHNG